MPRSRPRPEHTGPPAGRVAQWERRLLAAGAVLVTLHLLDVALSGPATTVAGVIAVLVLPLALLAAQPRVGRAARFALAVPAGALFAATGTAAHVLDLLTSGPRWADLTGVGAAAGGLLLIASGCAALTAPPRRPRATSTRRAAARAAVWLLGAVVVGQFVLLPLTTAVVATHAARLPVHAGALPAGSADVAIPMPRGGTLAGSYVRSRNGAAVLVVHGSGGNRGRVARHVALLVRHGYGALAIDLPGHGDSDGRASLIGANAQPAITASLDWLSRRPDVRPGRIAGLGTSLGAEVLLEAAARDARLRAVVADGAERVGDDRVLHVEHGLSRAVGAVGAAAVRGLSGMPDPPPLTRLLPAVAPRRVLLIAAGGRPHEIRVNRAYRAAAGPGAELWTLPRVGHTRGIRARPEPYGRRVAGFLAATMGKGARG